mmetsp:Transcript_18980/g.44491  ORF Transcript_18980/g.44491 Transcript_18980/m.44491 type:complete len:83 (-) Transcript_18980:55-303(-)
MGCGGSRHDEERRIAMEKVKSMQADRKKEEEKKAKIDAVRERKGGAGERPQVQELQYEELTLQDKINETLKLCAPKAPPEEP